MKRLFGLALLPVVLSACQMSAPIESDPFPQKEWRHEDGADAFYLLAPGDQLEVIVHTAPPRAPSIKCGKAFNMPWRLSLIIQTLTSCSQAQRLNGFLLAVM